MTKEALAGMLILVLAIFYLTSIFMTIRESRRKQRFRAKQTALGSGVRGNSRTSGSNSRVSDCSPQAFDHMGLTGGSSGDGGGSDGGGGSGD